MASAFFKWKLIIPLIKSGTLETTPLPPLHHLRINSVEVGMGGEGARLKIVRIITELLSALFTLFVEMYPFGIRYYLMPALA